MEKYTEDDIRLYRTAAKIAFAAHRGQKDKGGKDYIGHPLRVCRACNSAEAKAVALLHDTIEDTPVTREYLVSKGIPEHIADMVEVMSRKGGESYMDYIRRVAENPVTMEVKMADLRDNMDLTRLGCVTEQDIDRVKKYHKAYKYLYGIASQQTQHTV